MEVILGVFGLLLMLLIIFKIKFKIKFDYINNKDIIMWYTIKDQERNFIHLITIT